MINDSVLKFRIVRSFVLKFKFLNFLHQNNIVLKLVLFYDEPNLTVLLFKISMYVELL